MMESHEIYARAISAIGAKKVARALGLSLSHVYRFQRHPCDDSDPEGTGARNHLDALEQLVDILAAHPRARPVIVHLRLWFESLFKRALDRTQGEPTTLNELRAQSTNALREVADVVDACNDMETEFCRQKITDEALQARDLLDRIIAACEHDIEEA